MTLPCIVKGKVLWRCYGDNSQRYLAGPEQRGNEVDGTWPADRTWP